MSEAIAKFRFKGFRVLESDIKIMEDATFSSLPYSVELNNSASSNDKIIKLVLSAKVNTENREVEISIKSVGYFEFDNDLTKDQLDSFVKTNAPAIMFPYLRAYVSTLSSLSGIPAITLPTINLSARQ